MAENTWFSFLSYKYIENEDLNWQFDKMEPPRLEIRRMGLLEACPLVRTRNTKHESEDQDTVIVRYKQFATLGTRAFHTCRHPHLDRWPFYPYSVLVWWSRVLVFHSGSFFLQSSLANFSSADKFLLLFFLLS